MNDINIRSITYSINLEKIKRASYQSAIKKNIKSLKSKFKEENIFIRTIRLNTISIKQFPKDDKIFIEEISILSKFIKSINIRWFNISFNIIEMSIKDQKRIANLAYHIVKKFENSFVNFIVAKDNKVSPSAALITAEVIINISKISNNGFDNFRIGVSLNPSLYTPFFPFSYSDSDHSFSIAMEITERFLTIVKQNNDLETINKRVNKEIGEELKRINSIAKKFDSSGYKGIDASLAPFPDKFVSVVDILHKLGLDEIGASGSFFYTSVLTDMIKNMLKENNIKSVGFNGVMYSLLEDHLLCEANNRKMMSINQFIAYSTMCGCGLDMVPVPGNILIEELASIILDTAAISLKLDKPLGVRVLPIPNKDTNEYTQFDMDFLTNTRVMNLKNMHCEDKLFINSKFEYQNKGHH